MRQFALAQIRSAVGAGAVRVRGAGETYSLPNGKRFHLRTRQRDEQRSGWIRYWFGIQDKNWQANEYFVLVCDLDFVLIVPVRDWLPYMSRFSISHPGTDRQARQPHIYWRDDRYELREAVRDNPLVLDCNRWVNKFELLT